MGCIISWFEHIGRVRAATELARQGYHKEAKNIMINKTPREMKDYIMSQNYCTTKGLGWAFLICVFMILGVPIIMMMLTVPDYLGTYCKGTPLVPCFGMVD